VAEQSSVIGKDITRIDGILKVTGRAQYGVEYPLENMAWGVGVGSTIGAGRIASIDSAAMPALIFSGPRASEHKFSNQVRINNSSINYQ